MRSHLAAWQQVLGGIVLLLAVSAPLCATPQSFTVALPELEGPVTMGIFAADGRLVRLLYRDADIGSIPAGLNGLIMTWDGKDDEGREVPPGTYRARGLVHGPVSVSALPVCSAGFFSNPLGDLFQEKPLFPSDQIVLRAAPDELLESRPLLSIRAKPSKEGFEIAAEGLPLLTIPQTSVTDPLTLTFTHGDQLGRAVLTAEYGKSSEVYTVSGLHRIVPLEAGRLDIPADASHPAPVDGESSP
jgi:hypothetical protein